MTRLLVPTTPRSLAADSGDDRGFLSRLGKFIPAESGTLFTVANAYLLEEMGPRSDGKLPPPFLGMDYMEWAWIIFALCFLGNMILLDRMYEAEFKGNPLKRLLKTKHISASSIGFLIWAYAAKSPVFASYYKSFASFLLIGLFLIVVARIKPPVANA